MDGLTNWLTVDHDLVVEPAYPLSSPSFLLEKKSTHAEGRRSVECDETNSQAEPNVLKKISMDTPARRSAHCSTPNSGARR